MKPLRIYATHIPGYMNRWLIETPWFSLRLHKILRDDEDVELHDHPWAFTSIILRGAYREIEEHPSGVWGAPQVCTEFRAGDVNRRHDASKPHRLEVIDGPVWTLVWAGPRIRAWGFHGRDGRWTWWADFVSRKQNAPRGGA